MSCLTLYQSRFSLASAADDETRQAKFTFSLSIQRANIPWAKSGLWGDFGGKSELGYCSRLGILFTTTSPLGPFQTDDAPNPSIAYYGTRSHTLPCLALLFALRKEWVSQSQVCSTMRQCALPPGRTMYTVLRRGDMRNKAEAFPPLLSVTAFPPSSSSISECPHMQLTVG